MSLPTHRRAVRAAALLLLAVMGTTAWVFPRRARADVRSEAAAQAALKKAVTDFAAKKYAAAAARLNRSLTACRGARCSNATKAALFRDLGTAAYARGYKRNASTLWSKALALDSEIAFNPNYDAPEAAAAWEANKPPVATSAESEPAEIPPAASSPPTPPPPPAPEPGPAPAEPIEVAPAVTAPRYAHWWIGVSGALDFVVMPAATDACRLNSNLAPTNANNLYCTNPNGTDFPSASVNAELADAGRINGGLQTGDVRALLALDYAWADHFLLGARVGFVLNTYPGSAAVRDGRALGPKFHGELRLAYVFGHEPLRHEGFAPTAFLGGGVSEFDAESSTLVTLQNVAGATHATVWLTDAPFFGVAGGGVRYQFSPRIQLTAAGRLNVAFHGNGILPTFGPEVTVEAGF